MTDNLVSLRALLSLNNVEFYLVAFFEALVSVYLYGAVVYKNVRSIVASDKSVPFRVVKPLHLSLILRHEPYPSLVSRVRLGSLLPTCLLKRRRLAGFGFPCGACGCFEILGFGVV